LVVRELVDGQRRWNLQTTSPHHPEFIQSFWTFLDPTIDPREDSLCGPLQRRRCFCARGFGTRNPKIWQGRGCLTYQVHQVSDSGQASPKIPKQLSWS
jgi:hypothetical protein